MNRLLFKDWLVTEMADFGFDNDKHPKGGQSIDNDATPINPFDSHILINELVRLPPLGPNKPQQKWDDCVQWGVGVGAVQIDISPLGSYKIMARRQIKTLLGESVWICKKVYPLVENDNNTNELEIAHKLYDDLKVMSSEMVDGPLTEYDDFERLAWKLWAAVKRDHPSYCMFPIGLRKQNEDYYKIIFEFRGHGVEAPTRSRAEQFNIDLYWDAKRGLVRCWGYDILSAMGKHDWKIQPSEWDELFSPAQSQEVIIEAIVKTFMTY